MKSQVKRTPRACTYTVEVIKGQKLFTPVNKRAKKFARLVGGGKVQTLSQLRALKSAYGYRLLTSPDLKSIRV